VVRPYRGFAGKILEKLPSYAIIGVIMETTEIIVPVGFEAAHAEWLRRGGEMFQSQHFGRPGPEYYETEYWRLVRSAALQRDSHTCIRCRKPANQVHHLHYDFIGADHLHPETLKSICRPCHGLVEYARKADSLSRKIGRRIVAAEHFMADPLKYEQDGPTKTYARLLEYRDELARLKDRFTSEVRYSNPLKCHTRENTLTILRQKEEIYLVAGRKGTKLLKGSKVEKAAGIIQLLRAEITECERFQAYVFAPINLGEKI
jgi:hypothetical protein